MATAPAGEARSRREPDFDILDAEFETLPSSDGDPAVASATTRPAAMPVGGMDMLRNRGAMPAALDSLHAGPAFWAGGLSIVVAAFWFSGGHALMPEGLVAPKPAAQTLRIASVVSRVDGSGALAMLTIDGEAINDSRAAQAMLPLNIAVTGADGDATLYNLGTSGAQIAPGGKFAFASRLPMPRSGVKSVSVTFGRQH